MTIGTLIEFNYILSHELNTTVEYAVNINSYKRDKDSYFATFIVGGIETSLTAVIDNVDILESLHILGYNFDTVLGNCVASLIKYK